MVGKVLIEFQGLLFLANFAWGGKFLSIYTVQTQVSLPYSSWVPYDRGRRSRTAGLGPLHSNCGGCGDCGDCGDLWPPKSTEVPVNAEAPSNGDTARRSYAWSRSSRPQQPQTGGRRALGAVNSLRSALHHTKAASSPHNWIFFHPRPRARQFTSVHHPFDANVEKETLYYMPSLLILH